MVHYSGILLVAFLLTHVAAVHFHFSGRLNCPKRWFTYRMAMKEANCIKNDCTEFRLITNYTKPDISSIYPHTYSIKGYFNEHEPLLSGGNYEVFVGFYHTCTDTGKEIYLDVKFDVYDNWVPDKVYTEVKNLKMLNMAKSLDEFGWDDLKNEEED